MKFKLAKGKNLPWIIVTDDDEVKESKLFTESELLAICNGRKKVVTLEDVYDELFQK